VLVQHRCADEVVDAGRYRRLGDAAQSGVHEHGLADGQLVDEGVELRTVAELALRLLQRPGDAVAAQVRVAGASADVARQHLERRRLARSVDAQQAETLALWYACNAAVTQKRTEPSCTICHFWLFAGQCKSIADQRKILYKAKW